MTDDKIKLAIVTATSAFDTMYTAMTEEEKTVVKKVGEWFFKHYISTGYRKLD